MPPPSVILNVKPDRKKKVAYGKYLLPDVVETGYGPL